MEIFRIAFAGFLLTACAVAPAIAAEIRIACYSDGNECEVTQDLAKRFMQANQDVRITIDRVPFKAILESLPVQLAAGQGPDIARTTDFGAIARYFLDIRPLVKDAAYWDANFAETLSWMRTDPSDKGIYGLPMQLTVTAPIVNATLFEQAGVPMPGPKATWDEWAENAAKVAKATKTEAGMALDRSGHRFAAGALSYGAKYFAADGTPAPVDEGFRAFAERFVNWNKTGVIEREVWAATGGGSYRDAFEDFANGRIAVYYSGSWQLGRLQNSIGDGFEWKIGPEPCGPAACTGMPGGAAFVAFKSTKSPNEVARFLDYLASEPVYAEMMAKTANIPAHTGLQKSGVHYDLPAAAQEAMAQFTRDGGEIVPLAYRLQGYIYNRPIFNATVARLSQAIVGELTLDQALTRIQEDVKSAMAAAK
jgi:alpha-1,4-digalacturonate transport system substrate-binding protein